MPTRCTRKLKTIRKENLEWIQSQKKTEFIQWNQQLRMAKAKEEMEVIRWNHWRIGRTGKQWRLGRHKEGLRGSALGEAQVFTIFFDNKDEFF